MLYTKIKVAGLNINIGHFYDEFRTFAQKFITDEKHTDFSVSISLEDIETEKVYLEKQRLLEGRPLGYIPDEMFEQTAIYRKIADNLGKYQALVFHGSAVAVGEKAVVFSAISGTGKTTHTNLWLKNFKDCFVVDGDKPIIRIFDGKPFVCGTPWNGKEGMGTDKNIPLSAICRIIRSETNHIEKTKSFAFLPHLLEQIHCSKAEDAMSHNLKIIKEFTKTVSYYNLYCNMEDEAAIVAFEELMK